ncbi:MAG: glycerophosphodiester phosphodiesterase family protein [Bacilli bacterium]
METDISIIKNQAMILFHDDNLKRLTNIDKSLKDLTIKEGNEIELNARGTYHTYSYKIAYPKEYIRICKHYGKTPIIELKWGFTMN